MRALALRGSRSTASSAVMSLVTLAIGRVVIGRSDQRTRPVPRSNISAAPGFGWRWTRSCGPPRTIPGGASRTACPGCAGGIRRPTAGRTSASGGLPAPEPPLPPAIRATAIPAATTMAIAATTGPLRRRRMVPPCSKLLIARRSERSEDANPEQNEDHHGDDDEKAESLRHRRAHGEESEQSDDEQRTGERGGSARRHQ